MRDKVGVAAALVVAVGCRQRRPERRRHWVVVAPLVAAVVASRVT